MDKTWLAALSDEDLTFLKRFLLASGSLKKLAAAYGISYPTVRLRLDRLIQRVQIHEDQNIQSEFEKLLRSKVADGQIDMRTMKELLAAHEKELPS